MSLGRTFFCTYRYLFFFLIQEVSPLWLLEKKPGLRHRYRQNIPEVRDNTGQHQLVTVYQPAANLEKEKQKIHDTSTL